MTNTGWFTIALRLAFILGCVAVAQESVVLNFYPEVPVTSYRQITKLEFKFPKVTSSTSDGSAVDPRWVQNIKEALDGAQVELKDEFTQTFEALQNDASLPVTTNGIVTRTTNKARHKHFHHSALSPQNCLSKRRCCFLVKFSV